MPRDHAQAVLDAIYAPSTSECFLQLMTIEHDDLAEPIRLVNDHQSITSRGNVYQPLQHDAPPPGERENELPRISIAIDNVSQALTDALREDLGSAPRITIEVVLLSDPDVVIMGGWEYDLRQARYNINTVRADLGFEPYLEEPYPVGDYTPATVPVMFNPLAS